VLYEARIAEYSIEEEDDEHPDRAVQTGEHGKIAKIVIVLAVVFFLVLPALLDPGTPSARANAASLPALAR
jgi:hypothetical protein